MAVFVFVVCLDVYGALLSLSLWIVEGMVVVWLHSRGGGEERIPVCNCGEAEGFEKTITGLPSAIS